MATSTGEVGGAWKGNYRLVILMERTAVNVAENTSTLRSRVWIETKNGSSFYGQTSYMAHSIGGVLLVNGNYTMAAGLNTRTLIMDNSRVVGHNADGSLYVDTVASFGNSWSGDINVSASMWVDSIPRATTPNWSGDFEPLVAKTINLPRASAGFTHDVTYAFGTLTGTIATGAGVTTSWTPDMNLLTQIPNTASGTGTITVVTKSGGTVIGSKAVNFRLNAPASVVPNVTQVLWDDANTTVKANIGAFVQGLSLIRGAVTSEALYGASITEERIRIGTTIVPENNPIQITESGTVSAFGEAVDTRGRLGSLATSFPVLPYSPPLVNSWQVRRAVAGGTPSDTGQYLRLDLNSLVSSLKPAATEKNAMTITVSTRPVNGSWTTRNVITPGVTYNNNVLITGGAAFLVSSSYEVRVSIVDKTGVSPTVLSTTVPTATVSLDLNGTKVGIGKYHEQGALDVGGDGFFSGSVTTAGVTAGPSVFNGDISMSGSKILQNGAPYLIPGAVVPYAGASLPGGISGKPAPWVMCDGSALSRTIYADLFAVVGTSYGVGNGTTTFNVPDLRGRVPVGKSTDTEFNALGKKFGTKTHTLTVAELASHQHDQFVTALSGGSAVRNDYSADANGQAYNQGIKGGLEGGNSAHNNIQPSFTLNFIIKT